MTREEFYALTLRQWDALRKRREESQHRADSMNEVMVAQLIAMVSRCGMVTFKPLRKPEEFMPSHWKEEAAKAEQLTQEEREAAGWARYNAAKTALLERKERVTIPA